MRKQTQAVAQAVARDSRALGKRAVNYRAMVVSASLMIWLVS